MIAHLKKAWKAVAIGERRRAAIVLGHYLALLPMAFCIAMILISQEVMVRLAAVICLVFLEQIRDAWVAREMPGGK